MNEMTEEQKSAHFDTWQHIHEVQKLIFNFINKLNFRALVHDYSKMQNPEMETFAKFTPLLKNTIYGTEEYKKILHEMGDAIDCHYYHNRHHPEYYLNGINGMDLVDLIEMLCDWKAASKRTKDSNFEKSLEINKERFKISDQLFQILKNTVNNYWNHEKQLQNTLKDLIS